MQLRRLGRTELMVTEVGFGGIPIQRLTDEESVRVIRHCLDLGINYIDTAHGYGTSEERIGRAIAGRREGLVLASKAPARDDATFRQQMETSFQRLGVDYIDLYQFHNVATEEELDQVLGAGGAMEVALEAQSAGRIGHIGVTSHSPELSLKMVTMGCFSTLMFPFNFITTEPVDELIPLCREHDVAFIAMKPMGGGLLEDARPAFKYLKQVPDIIPLVGIEAAHEIDEIVSIVQDSAGLSADEMARIEALRDELGTRFCRRCDYCQPCPQEIAISTVMNLRSFGKRFPPERMFGPWGEAIVARAESCIDCGECESRCPYKLPIRQVIRENAAWFRAGQAAFQ
ncbi:MAG TPA: aldo/keto reductase [Chloroflexi bacterium]|jgi:predicted aldo/keto reductase-like oxidoreductase|nr:aldo/keto reductase [Chloroflexota bacterium]